MPINVDIIKAGCGKDLYQFLEIASQSAETKQFLTK